MKQAIGLVLVTLGAILRWAIDDAWDAADMSVIGLILMVVGAIAYLTDVVLEVTKRRAAAPATLAYAPPYVPQPQQQQQQSHVPQAPQVPPPQPPSK